MSDTTEDTEKTKRRRRQTQYFGWILVAMLIAGLGGFGVQSFGGGTRAVGSVGTQKMSTNAYARALREELNALSQQFGTQLTLSQALPFGVADRALQGLISRTALDGEMARVGLSVGDAVVADQIASITSFQGVSGTFDAATYRDTLSRNAMTEAEFEGGLRNDAARQILTAAVVGGFQAPPPADRKPVFVGCGKARLYPAGADRGLITHPAAHPDRRRIDSALRHQHRRLHPR